MNSIRLWLHKENNPKTYTISKVQWQENNSLEDGAKSLKMPELFEPTCSPNNNVPSSNAPSNVSPKIGLRGFKKEFACTKLLMVATITNRNRSIISSI